jgi:AcrR family transcriptional regulator
LRKYIPNGMFCAMNSQPAVRQDGRRAGARGTARERLLDAAAAVFAEHGYRPASVDDVAAAAGVTKGAVYWNFEGKEDLFLALIEERVDRRAHELIGMTEAAPREVATAPLVSRGLSSLVDEQQALVRLIGEYWGLAVRDEQVRKRYVERQRALRDHLARALEARHRTTGVPLTVPSERLATAIIALTTGLAQERIADPEAAPEELLGEMLSLIYDGLVKRAEAEA